MHVEDTPHDTRPESFLGIRVKDLAFGVIFKFSKNYEGGGWKQKLIDSVIGALPKDEASLHGESLEIQLRVLCDRLHDYAAAVDKNKTDAIMYTVSIDATDHRRRVILTFWLVQVKTTRDAALPSDEPVVYRGVHDQAVCLKHQAEELRKLWAKLSAKPEIIGEPEIGDAVRVEVNPMLLVYANASGKKKEDVAYIYLREERDKFAEILAHSKAFVMDENNADAAGVAEADADRARLAVARQRADQHLKNVDDLIVLDVGSRVENANEIVQHHFNVPVDHLVSQFLTRHPPPDRSQNGLDAIVVFPTTGEAAAAAARVVAEAHADAHTIFLAAAESDCSKLESSDLALEDRRTTVFCGQELFNQVVWSFASRGISVVDQVIFMDSAVGGYSSNPEAAALEATHELARNTLMYTGVHSSVKPPDD